MTKKHNLKITAGDTLSLLLSHVTLGEEGFDLTGWAVFLTGKVRKSDSDADAVIRIKVEDHLGADTTAITLTPVHTRAVGETRYSKVYYDIQFVSPDGSIVKTSHKGRIHAAHDITHRTN